MKRLVGILFGIALFLSGCATEPKVNWQSRVGTYTYDQALIDLGPPDKSAQLTDGTRVSDWMTSRGRNGGAWITQTRGGWVQTLDTPSPDYYLRLTFDPTGKLQSWKKYVK